MPALIADLLQRRGGPLVLIVAAFLLPMALSDALAGERPQAIAPVTTARPPTPVSGGDRILRAGDLRPAASLPRLRRGEADVVTPVATEREPQADSASQERPATETAASVVPRRRPVAARRSPAPAPAEPRQRASRSGSGSFDSASGNTGSFDTSD